MSLCKSGQIQNCCHPNALMTLKEYLIDYAKKKKKKIGEALIDKEIGNIANPELRPKVREELKKIETGVRDLYF